MVSRISRHFYSVDDVRRAWRRLVRRPGATLTMVMTIGASASPLLLAVGLANQDTLLQAGITRPDQLLRLSAAVRDPVTHREIESLLSPPEADRASRYLQGLGGVATSLQTGADIAWRGVTGRSTVGLVNDSYFRVLGVPFVRGRGFASDSTGAPVAVISESLWRTQLGAEPAVLGSTLRVNDLDVTVVGIVRTPFKGLDPTHQEAIWLPVALRSAFGVTVPAADEWDARVVTAVVRPTAGISVEQVRVRLNSLEPLLRQDAPPDQRMGRIVAGELERSPERRADGPAARLHLATVMLGLTLLMLACFNVAGIQFVRTVEREHDAAVRLALGGTWRHLVSAALLENAVISLLGVAVAALIGTWLLDLVRVQSGGEISGRLSLTILESLPAASLVITVILVLLPSVFWRRLAIARALTTGGRGERRETRRTRDVLVAVQVGLAVVAASTALILGRTIRQVRKIDPGFSIEQLYAVTLDFRRSATTQPELRARVNAVRDALRRIPGVRDAGIGLTPLLLHAAPIRNRIRLEDGTERAVPMDIVGPGYFAALGVKIREGRDFSPGDAADAVSYIIVNRMLAEELWAGRPVLGRTLSFYSRGKRVKGTVIGIVDDFMSDYVGVGVEPRVFFSTVQHPAMGTNVYVRSDPGANVVPEVRRRLMQLLPAAPTAPRIQSVEQVREQSMAFLKNASLVASVLAALAVILAASGLYAMQSHIVQRRRRDFGIQMALGASRARIARTVLLDAARTASWGLVAAVPLLLVVSQLARVLTIGTTVADPLTFAGTFVAMAAVVIAGSLGPAMMATCVNPIDIIRSE